MKLKNIIIVLGAALAFTACSKEVVPPGDEAKVKLSVKVKINSGKTKADDIHELPGESNINTLTALVFDPADGSKAGGLSVTPNVSYTYTMEGIPAAELSEAQVVLIANAPAAIANVSTYTELEALLAELSAQQQSSLTMSTQVITARNLQEGLNVLEDAVLTRLPARIEIIGVRTNFTRPLLVGRRVLINNVYLDNVKARSRYFSVDDWGKVQVTGNLLATSRTSFAEYTPITDLGYAAYVMENLDIDIRKTAVVIDATLEEMGQLPSLRASFRYEINSDGLQRRVADHNYVKRNYVYGLTITFGDNSFDPSIPPPPVPPTSTNLDVLCEVVSYGDVIMDPVFDE